MGNKNTYEGIKQIRDFDFGLVKIVNQKYDQSHGHITFVMNQTLKLYDRQGGEKKNSEGKQQLMCKDRANN